MTHSICYSMSVHSSLSPFLPLPSSLFLSLSLSLPSYLPLPFFLFLFLSLDRTEQAEQCYQKALLIQPDHINANINMGHLCRLQNRWSEALKHFSIASNRRPNQSALHYYVGLVHMKMGNFEVCTNN